MVENNVTDTLFADVSEFQTVVTDAYSAAGYEVLSIRSNDGTYQDHNFAQNYSWLRASLDSGDLTFGIVYCYCRPDWFGTANTMISQITSNGGLHPKVCLMLDVESGGNPAGDGSDWVNRTYWALADWIGSGGQPCPRIIGYGNVSDLNTVWPTKPPGIQLIVAGYGSKPDYPNMVAHQYTDGNGYGGGLPEGAPPWANCDMNSADGLSVQAFAAACGLGVPVPPPPPAPPPPAPLPPVPLPEPTPVGGPATPGPWWPLPTDDSILTAAEEIVGQFVDV